MFRTAQGQSKVKQQLGLASTHAADKSNWPIPRAAGAVAAAGAAPLVGFEGILGAAGLEGIAGFGLPTTEDGRDEAGVEEPEPFKPPLRACIACASAGASPAPIEPPEALAAGGAGGGGGAAALGAAFGTSLRL